MVQKIDRFDPSRPTKAFSYFGTAAKRYLIQKTRKRSKVVLYQNFTDNENNSLMRTHDDEDVNTSIDTIKNAVQSSIENSVSHIYDVSDRSEAMNIICEKILDRAKNCESIEYKKFLEAFSLVITTCRNMNDGNLMINRKFLKMYIKQITQQSEKQISRYLYKSKKEFLENIYDKYKGGNL